MPRKIVSQDPVTRPAQVEKTYDDMKMTSFRYTEAVREPRARIELTPYDFETDELAEDQPVYRITLNNFNQQIAQSPKMQRAWDDINDVMGLAYDYFVLRDKVKAAKLNPGNLNEEDLAAIVDPLVAARNAALAALRAPIS